MLIGKRSETQMFIKKNISFKTLLQFSWFHVAWIVLWVSAVAVMYSKFDLWTYSIPALPLAVLGTAVAFYVGFKNNSAYDRLWEARKIWGGIVNSSRAWGSVTRHIGRCLGLPNNGNSRRLL